MAIDLKIVARRFYRYWAISISTIAILILGGTLTLAIGGRMAPNPAVGTYVNSVGITFIWVPDGEHRIWLKGDTINVTVPGFWISKYEITQEQSRRIGRGGNPSVFPFRSNSGPMDNIDYRDAHYLCVELNNEWMERSFGRKYRLPSELEWEFACQDSKSDIPWEERANGLVLQSCWHQQNAGGRTQPVGKLLPNSRGLFDMHGNVAEWCDPGPDAYYDNSNSRTYGVAKGGSWNDSRWQCGATNRYIPYLPPSYLPPEAGTTGLRIVME